MPSNLLTLAEAGHGIAVVQFIVPTHRYTLRVASLTHERKPIGEPLAVVVGQASRVLLRYTQDFCRVACRTYARTFPLGQASAPMSGVAQIPQSNSTQSCRSHQTDILFTRLGSSHVANSAKARENVDSLGTCPGRSQPHSRRKRLSTASRSISIDVVGSPITALATNARANAARSRSGRPGRPGQSRISVSMRTSSSVASSIWVAQNVERKARNFLGHKFWARGYFVSTVGRDEQMIRAYIKNQEMADQQLDQLQLKLGSS